MTPMVRIAPDTCNMQAKPAVCGRAAGHARRSGAHGPGMVSAKPTNVSAAHPLRTHPRPVLPSRHRRVHIPVIVHADDFGETVEITEGICQAISAGVVTSTS